MTTIAYKNGLLAADSLVTEYGRSAGHSVKIGRIANNIGWGGAGDLHMLNSFREWLKNGMKGDFLPKKVSKGSSMRIIYRADTGIDYKLDWYNGVWDVSSIEPDLGCAVGSGAPLALGAMAFGANAEQAVQIAIRLDTGSGGTISRICLQSPLVVKDPDKYFANLSTTSCKADLISASILADKYANYGIRLPNI